MKSLYMREHCPIPMPTGREDGQALWIIFKAAQSSAIERIKRSSSGDEQIAAPRLGLPTRRQFAPRSLRVRRQNLEFSTEPSTEQIALLKQEPYQLHRQNDIS